MDRCPACSSPDIHHSRSKSKWEHWRKDITGKRPYRCNACGWRGWGVDVGPKFGDREIKVATRALAPEPPNLKGTVLARTEPVPDLDVAKLDCLAPIEDKPDE